MPCRCDHLEPREHERESKRVAALLVYIATARNVIATLPEWIKQAATAAYGNEARVHDLTALLCDVCDSMTGHETARLIYDGRNPDARKLAEWWEAHQLADKAREAREKETLDREALKQSALAKLSPKERAALGL